MTDGPDLSLLTYAFSRPGLLKIYLVIIVVSGVLLSISTYQLYIAMSEPDFYLYPFEKSDRMVLAFISGGLGAIVILGGVASIIYKVGNDVLQKQQ